MTEVYVTTGTVYHSQEDCPGLDRARNPTTMRLEVAKAWEYRKCKHCYPEEQPEHSQDRGTYKALKAKAEDMVENSQQ